MNSIINPEEFFRRKIVVSFDAPPMTVELRNEILGDILSAFLELKPTSEECEPTWRRLIQEHRGRKWPTAFDMVKALRSVREDKNQCQLPNHRITGNNHDEQAAEFLTPEERLRGDAFMAMLNAYMRSGQVQELLGLSGRELSNRALEEGFASDARSCRGASSVPSPTIQRMPGVERRA